MTTLNESKWKQAWRWWEAKLQSWHPRPQRQLRVCENLALGDHRMLSVVEFGRRRFLIGGTGNSLRMLAALPNETAPELPQEDPTPTWKFVDEGLVRCG